MKLLCATLTILTLTACSGFRSAPGGDLVLGSTNSSGLVVTSPSVSVTAPQAGMVGVPVDVGFNSPATLMNPRWDFGDGSAVTTATSHTYQAAGTYTIRLVTDQATASQDIQILAYSDTGSTCINQLALTVPSAAIVGQNVNFALSIPSCLTGAITSVIWDFGDGTTLSGPNATHTFATLGTYTIEVTVASALGEINLGLELKIVSATLPTPTDPRGQGNEPKDPAVVVTPVAPKGGWNPMDNSYCSGIAEYGGRVDCVSYAFCSGTSCGAQDGAVATCRYTYYQGASDFRLQAGAWEWWTENMDHPAKGWGCAVTGIEPRLNSAVFDPAYYLANNPDVKASMQQWDLGPDVAKRHWLAYGVSEGRRASAAFSAKAYLARYADLRAAFGSDYSKATIHYVTYGIKEGRNGLP